MSKEDMRFSQMTTFGDHLYRRKGQIAEIIMENTRAGIRKTIVNDDGMIAEFPGFAYPKLVSLYSDGVPTARIRFRSDISRLGDHYALIWQIRPDGRYWEDDDGFGGTSNEEIDLYARLDETGHFIESLHFYSIGNSKLYDTDAEEQLMQTLQMKGDPLVSLRAHIPQMLAVMKDRIKTPEEGAAAYAVPGTICQAAMELKEEGEKWFVRVSMNKRYSGTSVIAYLKFAPLEEQRAYLESAQAAEDAEREFESLLYHIR